MKRVHIELKASKAEVLKRLDDELQNPFFAPSEGFIGSLCKGTFAPSGSFYVCKARPGVDSTIPVLYGKVVKHGRNAAIEAVYRLSTYAIGFIVVWHAMVFTFMYVVIRFTQGSVLSKLGFVTFLAMFLVAIWAMIAVGAKRSRGECDEIEAYLCEILSGWCGPGDPRQENAGKT